MLKILFVDDASNDIDQKTGEKRVSINNLENIVKLRQYQQSSILFKTNIDDLIFFEKRDDQGNFSINASSLEEYDLLFIHYNYDYVNDGKKIKVSSKIANALKNSKTKIFTFSGSASNDSKQKSIKRSTIYPPNNSLLLFLDYLDSFDDEQEYLLYKGVEQFPIWIKIIENLLKDNLTWRNKKWQPLFSNSLMIQLLKLANYSDDQTKSFQNLLSKCNAAQVESHIKTLFFNHLKSRYKE